MRWLADCSCEQNSLWEEVFRRRLRGEWPFPFYWLRDVNLLRVKVEFLRRLGGTRNSALTAQSPLDERLFRERARCSPSSR